MRATNLCHRTRTQAATPGGILLAPMCPNNELLRIPWYSLRRGFVNIVPITTVTSIVATVVFSVGAVSMTTTITRWVVPQAFLGAMGSCYCVELGSVFAPFWIPTLALGANVAESKSDCLRKSRDLSLGGLRSEVEKRGGLQDALPQPCAPGDRGWRILILILL